MYVCTLLCVCVCVYTCACSCVHRKKLDFSCAGWTWSFCVALQKQNEEKTECLMCRLHVIILRGVLTDCLQLDQQPNITVRALDLFSCLVQSHSILPFLCTKTGKLVCLRVSAARFTWILVVRESALKIIETFWYTLLYNVVWRGVFFSFLFV